MRIARIFAKHQQLWKEIAELHNFEVGHEVWNALLTPLKQQTQATVYENDELSEHVSDSKSVKRWWCMFCISGTSFVHLICLTLTALYAKDQTQRNISDNKLRGLLFLSQLLNFKRKNGTYIVLKSIYFPIDR